METAVTDATDTNDTIDGARYEAYVEYSDYIRVAPAKGVERDVYVKRGVWWAPKVSASTPDKTPRAYRVDEYIKMDPQNRVRLSRRSKELLKVACLTGSWDPVTVQPSAIHSKRIEKKAGTPRLSAAELRAEIVDVALAPIRAEIAALRAEVAMLRSEAVDLTALVTKPSAV